MPLGVLEARIWNVSVVVGRGRGTPGPYSARDTCIWMGEWGGAPESCARYMRCCCEHLLGAKGSLDACVERCYGCVRGHGTLGPCNPRDGAF